MAAPALEDTAALAPGDEDVLSALRTEVPEEDSPFDPEAQACLFVRLHAVDAAGTALRPLARQRCRVQGPVPGDAVSLELTTDADGELLLDGCPSGAYLILAGAQSCQVHTLFPSDLEQDTEPFLAAFPPAAAVPEAGAP